MHCTLRPHVKALELTHSLRTVLESLLCTCRVAGRISGPGVSGPEGSTSAALLNRDDASIGPSEDEEASLLPAGGQGRRTTTGSLDSIFERMETQPV